MLKPITLLAIISFLCNSVASKLVDLSWEYDNNTIAWPGNANFKFIRENFNKEHGYYTNDFCTAEHSGTHLDAPSHFNQRGWKVDEIPLERLVANGVVLETNDAVLEPKHLKQWQEKNGDFPDNCLLIVKFNWALKYQNYSEYLGSDSKGNFNFPGISKEAAEWIVTKKIVGVGVDTASVDPGNCTEFWAHKTLTGKQVYSIENLKLIETLPIRNFTVMVLPMKIKNGTGAPVRVIADVK